MNYTAQIQIIYYKQFSQQNQRNYAFFNKNFAECSLHDIINSQRRNPI